MGPLRLFGALLLLAVLLLALLAEGKPSCPGGAEPHREAVHIVNTDGMIMKHWRWVCG